MHFSAVGIAFLRTWEGVYRVAYPDSDGKLTIGVGHLLTPSERSSGKLRLPVGAVVRWGNGLSLLQVDALLRQDLLPVEHVVGHKTKRLTPALAQHEVDALVCLVFNIGCEAFAQSTLLKRLLAGDRAGVVVQWHRWIYDGGQIIQGLRNRRAAELVMWEGK